jgi:lysophospholipid acyltransferase (LPLAT)-like uncharacterized protein
MNFLRRQFLPWIAAGILRVWGKTLQLEFVDDAGATSWPEERQCILAFWHNRILVLPIFYERFVEPRRVHVMISLSKDGQWISDIIRFFQLYPVRGSTSRHAVRAGKEMLDVLAQHGNWGGVTPDGPRGPRYAIQPGLIALAQMAGVPIVPLRVDALSYWELKSWDRFQIPKPWSRVRISFGEPIAVPEKIDEAGIEGIRLRVSEALGVDR